MASTRLMTRSTLYRAYVQLVHPPIFLRGAKFPMTTNPNDGEFVDCNGLTQTGVATLNMYPQDVLYKPIKMNEENVLRDLEPYFPYLKLLFQSLQNASRCECCKLFLSWSARGLEAQYPGQYFRWWGFSLCSIDTAVAKKFAYQPITPLEHNQGATRQIQISKHNNSKYYSDVARAATLTLPGAHWRKTKMRLSAVLAQLKRVFAYVIAIPICRKLIFLVTPILSLRAQQ